MSDTLHVIEAYIAMYATRDVSRVAEIVDAAFVDRTLPHFSGPDGVARAVAILHQMIADPKITLEHVVVNGDTGAFMVRAEGRDGAGKRVLLRAADFVHVVNGKITELWTVQSMQLLDEDAS